MKIDIGPIVLIVLGTLLLLMNLDLLPMGKIKAIAAVWWPVVLIDIGVMQFRKR